MPTNHSENNWKWKNGNTEQWVAYNKHIGENKIENYQQLHLTITNAILNCIGKAMIDTARNYKIKNKDIKEARVSKR